MFLRKNTNTTSAGCIIHKGYRMYNAYYYIIGAGGCRRVFLSSANGVWWRVLVYDGGVKD